MRKLINELKTKSIDIQKLLNYGFIKYQDSYRYKTKICNDKFEMIVELKNNELTSILKDVLTKEEYILVDIPSSNGTFVGNVRNEYQNKINDIINNCTNINVFKSKQAQEIIKYITDKYQDELEYLWEKFPENAIWCNRNNRKWYGLILTVNASKLGINSSSKIEIINLRYSKDEIDNIVDNIKIFRGYHMNKNSWITIKLDGTVNIKDIYNLIDNSYKLSLKK